MVARGFMFCSPECLGEQLTPCNHVDGSHLNHMVNEVTIVEDETFEQFDERINNLEKGLAIVHKLLNMVIRDLSDEQLDQYANGFIAMTFNDLNIKGVA